MNISTDTGSGSMWTATMGLKQVLRSNVKRTLETLPRAKVLAQSQQIAQHVIESSAFRNSTSVSCYLAMERSAEVDTREIVNAVLNTGKKLFVPRVNIVRRSADRSVDGTRERWMSMLRVYSMEDYLRLKKSTWGIPEPRPDDGPDGEREDASDSQSEGVDLILMPGLAFDLSLSRLGHGRGYYDNWLTYYATVHAQGTRPLLMGLALEEQVVERVPIEPHDWPLDLLATPSGIWPS